LVKVTSRGPAFYRQERVGLNQKVFRIIKLRTMRADAEKETGPVWAAERDPRVTPLVGAHLRRMHLDELPQLWNVVRGEMSLVGPRPERPVFVAELIHNERLPGYERRLTVKPGITGLAQVRNGYDHSLHDVRRKLKLDLIYARRMCWWVDFTILVKTLGRLLAINRKGVHGGRQQDEQ
jgi:lipopolysaccharide/colanic/teichoic acid biosynthesis glycosyltransferase